MAGAAQGRRAGGRPAKVAEATKPAEPVAAEPVAAEPVAAEPVAAEPVAAEPVAAETTPRAIVVVGPRRGRRRSGRSFGPEAVTIPLAELGDDELAAILGDSELLSTFQD